MKHPLHKLNATTTAGSIGRIFFFGMCEIISDLGLTCHGLLNKINRRMGKLWEKLRQIFYFTLFAVVLVAGVMLSYPKYSQAQGLCRKRDQVLRRIDEKRREIAAIRDKQRRFKTDREFVESLARENRRVFPNELVFVFED